MRIRKAVIPAAGLGTRFLPVTMSVPKELLPIIDRPLIQYVITEAVEAEIEEIIIITSPEKTSMNDYLRHQIALNHHLMDNGSDDQLAKIVESNNLAKISFVLQEEALGLGHAVLMAKQAVGSEPFVVILPDDIISHSPGAISQTVKVYEKMHAGVIAVKVVPWGVVENYGVVDAVKIDEQIHRIEGMVEKPARGEAPSNMTVVGRYILPPEIFPVLEETIPGSQGEIQLTDALMTLLGKHELYAYEFNGIRYDCGSPMGLLRTSLAFALDRKDTSQEATELLRDFQRKIDL